MNSGRVNSFEGLLLIYRNNFQRTEIPYLLANIYRAGSYDGPLLKVESVAAVITLQMFGHIQSYGLNCDIIRIIPLNLSSKQPSIPFRSLFCLSNAAMSVPPTPLMQLETPDCAFMFQKYTDLDKTHSGPLFPKIN